MEYSLYELIIGDVVQVSESDYNPIVGIVTAVTPKTGEFINPQGEYIKFRLGTGTIIGDARKVVVWGDSSTRAEYRRQKAQHAAQVLKDSKFYLEQLTQCDPENWTHQQRESFIELAKKLTK